MPRDIGPIEMAEAARELARDYPVSVEAALQMIRDFGGVDQARRWLKEWAGGESTAAKRTPSAAGEAPLWELSK